MLLVYELFVFCGRCLPLTEFSVATFTSNLTEHDRNIIAITISGFKNENCSNYFIDDVIYRIFSFKSYYRMVLVQNMSFLIDIDFAGILVKKSDT